MGQTTFAEKRLCSIWARYSDGLAWMDCANVLTDIAAVLRAEGCIATAELFSDAADLAFGRLIQDIQQRRAA